MRMAHAWRALYASVVALSLAACGDGSSRADAGIAARIASGKGIYDKHCAACHGANLEGEPNWRSRKSSGRMPAPPHDDSGHTWHHPDDVLFGITRGGVAPPFGPPGYESDMPGFGAVLSDSQIRDVLAYIKSRWSPRSRDAQRKIDEERRR